MVEDDGPRRRLDDLLELDHVDLMDDARRAWGGYRSLKRTCAELGVASTPSIFINGQLLEGGADWETLRDAIEAAAAAE